MLPSPSSTCSKREHKPHSGLLGRSRYQTSEFPSTSEFPTELPTHNEGKISPNLSGFPLTHRVENPSNEACFDRGRTRSNHRFRAKREQLKTCEGLSPDSPDHNLALSVLYAPSSLGSGSATPPRNHSPEKPTNTGGLSSGPRVCLPLPQRARNLLSLASLSL